MVSFWSKIIKNNANSQYSIRIPSWIFKAGNINYIKEETYLVNIVNNSPIRSFNSQNILKDKNELISNGFTHDIMLDEYVKSANKSVRKGWSKDRKTLNSEEELKEYSWNNKVQFLDGTHRIGKLNWKEIRFLYDREEKPDLEIHTYNGFCLCITQSKITMHSIGIPGLDQTPDTYSFNTIPTFSYIEFYGNFDFIIPITFLHE